MKRITMFGMMYGQHISNFAHSLKNHADYLLYGVNKEPKYVLGEEYKKQAQLAFDEIYELPQSRIKFIDYIIRSIWACFAIVKYAKRSELVQFHAITPFILPLATLVKIFSKAKISSFVYGSDYLRANKISLWCLGRVFSMSDSIVCDSSTLYKELIKGFPQYEPKMSCCLFGSSIIDKLIKKTEKYPSSSVDKIGGGKKVIMCGYNGLRQQRHLEVIESLKSVAKDFYWIFPMTYYNSDLKYKQDVINRLDDLGVEYEILDRFLTEEEWTNYLLSADIFIHMQVSDAFSSSISEHLLLGHVLINGSWLRYEDLDDNGIYYVSSDFEHLQQNLMDVLNNYDAIEEKLKANKEKIIKLKSLDYCIQNNWIPYFDNLLK